MNPTFLLTYSSEDGGYIATVPAVPGLSAFGITPEIALAEALVVLELWRDCNLLGVKGSGTQPATRSIRVAGLERGDPC